MESKNRFFVGKSRVAEIVPNYSYNLQTGAQIQMHNTCSSVSQIVSGIDIVKIEGDLSNSHAYVLKWDSSDNYLGYELLSESTTQSVNIVYEIPNGVYKIAFMFTETLLDEYMTLNGYIGYNVHPHYKELKKSYKKENNQVFFRESLDGQITLWGQDYEKINDASLEDELIFKMYRGSSLYASASFNKSDCKFDHERKKVELKLTYNDAYSKILEAYDNTYDLMKLAPAITPLTLTKRCIVQVYIQGEEVISNYSGGTYWETEVNEQVNDANLLRNKYHFALGPKYVEVSLSGFNYSINAAFVGLWNSNIWNSTSILVVNGEKYKFPCSIVFTKIANQGDIWRSGRDPETYLMSDGTSSGLISIPQSTTVVYAFDSYRIEIYTGQNGTGEMIYKSRHLYGKNGDRFILKQGENLYPMDAVAQPIPMQQPEPSTFNLGNFIIEYQIWGRLLCDVESYESSRGVITQTYELPGDDFATARRNYRRCIGLTGFDSSTSVVKIYQNQNTTETPNAYGLNDFGEYFLPPTTLYGQYFFPLSRSAWANTSMWVMLDELAAPFGGFEAWSSKTYKEYTLKNSYHIGDVIKALLAKISPDIKHEKTSDYSQFLYGHSGATASALGNCDIYITQKSNILKGEYDQAAQKAEIKFKQLMEMLRDCFRCYWFIDDQNRFRIEHISYFMKGLSYYAPTVQLDLTSKRDKFNKQKALRAQKELEYDKTELTSRYEFEWADDVTDSIGNLTVDITNKYLQKDKTEEINIDGFTADLDYMIFLPDDFASDGFALLLANQDKKVPIVHQTLKSEQQYNRTYDVYVQNWYASFNQLIWHYMEDMPGNRISANNLPGSIYVTGIKKCMKHDIEFTANGLDLDVYKLIRTDSGEGQIEDVKFNVDTDLAEVELRYTPG